jgi:hypothetical protein
MKEYLHELNELRSILSDVGNYSIANAFLLQVLIEKYDSVAEQLYAMNSTTFRASPETIAECELGIAFLNTQHSIKEKMLVFDRMRYNLRKAVLRDICKYGHLKIIGSPQWN